MFVPQGCFRHCWLTMCFSLKKPTTDNRQPTTIPYFYPMQGIVLKSTGSWYLVKSENDGHIECRIKGVFRLKGIKATNPVAVGDRVEFEYDDKKNTGVITKLQERKNYIIRRSTKLSKQFHIIAANIDQAFILAAVHLPRTSPGFIDRFLAVAEAYSIPVKIIFNKKDVCDEKEKQAMQELVRIYENAGYSCHVISSFDKTDQELVKTMLKGKTTLLAGHSGVGKSTLINSIEPRLDLKTAELSETHLKGTHTTTFAEMHALSFGAFIIDTPGIKEFGMIDFEKQELAHYFPEMRRRMHLCKFNNCLHLNEPGCAVLQAVDSGEIAASRYTTYLNIMNGDELLKEYE